MIEAIFIAKEDLAKQEQVDSIQVVRGKGIVGDRNFDKSKWPGQNLTFIEAEEIDRFNSAYNQNIELCATRRNIITRGVRLNDLVGKVFFIGNIKLKGVMLCEPCVVLGDLLKNKTMKSMDVVNAFVHKGGLRVDVLTDGFIEVGMEFN